ncbi:MAG: chemotaxis protein CheW [Halarchaeum sp.]
MSTATAPDSNAEPDQVLEFGLGEETYCLDISYVDEIVDAGELTTIPNTPRHVEGVMDLRGRTTTIIDPKSLFDITGEGARERIVVFDTDAVGEQGTVGWIVDDVYQVRTVNPEDVDAATIEDDSVHGIIKDDDGFVIWVQPTFDV